MIDDEKLQELLTQASSLYNNGNYQGAITSWQEALSVDPSNQKAREGIRMATLLLGEWEPAAPEAEGAAETAEGAEIGGAPVASLPPEEVEARLDLGMARVKQLLAERKYREAVDGAKSLLPLAPESDDLHRLIEEAQHGFESTPFVDEHLTLARELLAQERYAEAESECKKIFVIDPRHPAGSALMREIRARVQESLQRAASQMGGMTVKLSLPDLKNLRAEGMPREAARPAAPEPTEPGSAAPEAGRWPPYAPPSKEEIAAGMEPPAPAASEFAESDVAGVAGPPGVPAPPSGAHPPGAAHPPRIGHPPASTAPDSSTGDLAHSQEEVRARDLLDQAFAAEGVAEPPPEPAEPSQTAAPEPAEPAPPPAAGGLPISHVEDTESPFELSHGVTGPKAPETVEAKTITPPTVRKVPAAKEGGRDAAPPAPPAPAPSLEFKGTDDPSAWEAELAQLNLKEGERGLLGRKPMPPSSGSPAEVPDVDLMSLLDADIGGPPPKPAPAAGPPPLPQKAGAKPEKPAVQPGVKPVGRPEKAAAAKPAATPRQPRMEPRPAAGDLQESAESLESVAERPARPKTRPRPVPARSSSPFLFVLLGLVLVAGGGAAWWFYFQPKFLNAASAGSPAQTSGPPQGAPAPPDAGGGPIPTPIGGPARPAQEGGAAEAAVMTGPPPAPSIGPQGGGPAAAAPAARTPPVDAGPIKPREAPRLSPEEMRRRVAVFTADGRRLMGQGKWREARAKFNAVLALDPTNFDVKEMHDEVQAKIDDEQRLIDDMDSAKQLVADKDYENALRKLYRLPRDRGLGNIDLYIRNAWFNWAVVQLKAGNAKDALVKLSEVLTLDPDDAEALRLQEVAERYLNKAKDRVYYAFTDTLRLRAFDQK